jgi:RNA polymerase sigma-70 factor (ECF subfamily)
MMANDPEARSMQRLSDAELVRRGLLREEAALRALVRRYEQPVFALCFRMLGHRHDAEDAAQEVLVRAVRSLHRWDSDRPMRPWLLTIAANRCRTLLVQRVRWRAVVSMTDGVADPRPNRPRADLQEELTAALGQLQLNHRTAFTLFYEQELSCSEVAEIMQCPLGTIKVWLHRARRQLADHLRRRGVVPETTYAMR